MTNYEIHNLIRIQRRGDVTLTELYRLLGHHNISPGRIAWVFIVMLVLRVVIIVGCIGLAVALLYWRYNAKA